MKLALVFSSDAATDAAERARVDGLLTALQAAGHEPALVDAHTTATELSHTLAAIGPDLVWTSLGADVRARESFVVSLAEQLGIACVGSDSRARLIAGSEDLARLVVGAAGVPTATAGSDLRVTVSVAGKTATLAKDADGSWGKAKVDAKTKALLTQRLGVVTDALGLTDVAAVTWAFSEGDVAFVSVDTQPRWASGEVIDAALRDLGFKSAADAARAAVKAAATRHGVKEVGASKSRVRVGLIFNVKRIKPHISGDDDDDAEYDAPSTIDAIREAIESLGHEVVMLEARADILRKLEDARIDVAFNVSEGLTGRAREAVVPAILDMLQIPFTGSDAATMALTLDKALAKRVVRDAGVPTPRSLVMFTGKEKLPSDMKFPVMVKPVAEGSSKGVQDSGVAESEAELRSKALLLIQKYKQPALVETYLPGREFTVGLLGGPRPRVLPPMEIVFDPNAKNPVYSFAHKQEAGLVSYEVPAKLDAKLQREIESVVRQAFDALGCRDVARIDVRCDADGVVNFIECNPLPGLTPGWSDLCLIATAAGIEYAELIKLILTPALRRLRNQRRALTGMSAAE